MYIVQARQIHGYQENPRPNVFGQINGAAELRMLRASIILADKPPLYYSADNHCQYGCRVAIESNTKGREKKRNIVR